MTRRFFIEIVMVVFLACLLGGLPGVSAEQQVTKQQAGCSLSGGKGCHCLKQLKGLSDKEREQVKKEMQAFHEVIGPVKQAMVEKKTELISLLAKEDVDVDKAKQLQSEISDLENQLGQKKIDCLVQMKKISPEAGRFCLEKCFMKGKGMCGCKRGGSCPRKIEKSRGSCPGKKRLKETNTN